MACFIAIGPAANCSPPADSESSCQQSVAGCQFELPNNAHLGLKRRVVVLGSQFSVLSSQFSVGCHIRFALGSGERVEFVKDLRLLSSSGGLSRRFCYTKCYSPTPLHNPTLGS